jgi:hypothetical protein
MEKDALKISPFRKEQIPREAVKCRYCGEWLEEKAKNPDARTASEIAPAPSTNVAPQADSSSGLCIENPAQNLHSIAQTPSTPSTALATGEAESANSMKALGRTLDEKCASPDFSLGHIPGSVRGYTNAEPPVRLAVVIRDVVIIQALIFIGGIITGVAVGNTNSLGLLIDEGIAALFLGTFGFAISCLISRL